MEMTLPRSLVLYNVFELRTYLLCFVSFCDLFSGVCVQKFRSPFIQLWVRRNPFHVHPRKRVEICVEDEIGNRKVPE